MTPIINPSLKPPIQITPTNARPKRLNLIARPTELPDTTTLADAKAKKPLLDRHKEIYASANNLVTYAKTYRETIIGGFTDEMRAHLGPEETEKIQRLIDSAKTFVNTNLPGAIL